MSIKKGFIVFIVALLCCFFIPYSVEAADNNVSGEWEYTISCGEATLVAYNGTSLEISIPSSIDGYPVTAIGEKIFDGSMITELSIPSPIEKIGSRAFADCKYLRSIYYDAQDCDIYYFRSMMELHVFQNAGKFSDSLIVTFGPNVKTIPKSMFEASEENYAHVTSVIISDSVEIIDGWAFGNCYDLKTVTWGNNIQRIEWGAFCNCTQLSSIKIPEKTEYIGLNAFKGCKYLSEILFNAKNCEVFRMRSSMGEHVFVDAGKFSGSLKVTFGKTVNVIPASLFEAPDTSYAHITQVVIPSSVSEIGAFSFNNCKDLKTVIVYGKTSIPTDEFSNPFSGCSNNLIFKCLRDSDADKYAKQYKYKVSYLNTKAPEIISLKNSSEKSMIVKWKKIIGASGYEIQYSTNRNFSGKKVVVVTSTSKQIQSLKKGKNYYVRIRTYKTVAGNKYYSSWSSVSKVKITK